MHPDPFETMDHHACTLMTKRVIYCSQQWTASSILVSGLIVQGFGGA